MKRKIAVLLMVMMLVLAVLPMQAFAADEKGLGDMIKIAKAKFTIPDAFTEFNYSINTENARKVWYLNWNSKGNNAGSANVSIDESGTIINYNFYKPYNYNIKKFPKVNKSEARLKADEFLKKINPELVSQVKVFDNGKVDYLNGDSYYFSYTRMVNGIPFYPNSINIGINRETAVVQSYNYNWSDSLNMRRAEGLRGFRKFLPQSIPHRLVS